MRRLPRADAPADKEYMRMGDSEERPRANANSPDLNNPDEVLRALLAIEWERLETAKRIERERNIVFPETTVIIRDIQKLMAALEKKDDSIDDWPLNL